MADEYGNIECGLEIIENPDDTDLPKVMEASAVYALQSDEGLALGYVSLPLQSADPLPPGYSVAGVKSAVKTTIIYDAAEDANKQNGNSAMYPNMEELFIDAYRWSNYPESVGGYLYRSLSAGSNQYLEITATFVLMPSGMNHVVTETV